MLILLLFAVSIMHLLHTVVGGWNSVYMELAVTIGMWFTLFWFNVVERWRSFAGREEA